MNGVASPPGLLSFSRGPSILLGNGNTETSKI